MTWPAALATSPTTLDLPRIALVSTHGYVAANPPLGAADTGGQVVYVLELATRRARRRTSAHRPGRLRRPGLHPEGIPVFEVGRVGRECSSLHSKRGPQLCLHRQPLLGRRGRGAVPLQRSGHAPPSHAALVGPLEATPNAYGLP